MMQTDSIVYLVSRKMKNSIKQLVKSPAKLIYAILMIALIVMSAISRNMDNTPSNEYRDIRELSAGITALYILMFFMISYNGFKNGATMFKMADVNLLFTSPVKPIRILFYGMIQQLGTSLLLGLFIIFQYGWMSTTYGLDFIYILWILAGYALTIFAAQLCAMVIYFFTSYDEKRKRILFFIFFGILALYASGLVLFLLNDRQNIVTNLVIAGNSIYIRLLGAGGFTGGIVSGILQNNTSMILAGSISTISFLALLVYIATRSNEDFYEDVLSASEDQEEIALAKKEGRLTEGRRKIKTGKIGITKGYGASVLYYKHQLENRRSKKFFIEPAAWIFMVITVVMGFFMKNSGGIIAVFIYSVYMQMITISMGRFAKELKKPYIYLIPETSNKKIIHAIRETFISFLAESFILFCILAFAMDLSVAEVIVFTLARLSFSYLIISANILVQRVFGTVSSRTLIFTFYALSIMIMSTPGVVAAIFVAMSGFVLFSENILPFITMTLCNIPITLLVIYLCRDLLKHAEVK